MVFTIQKSILPIMDKHPYSLFQLTSVMIIVPKTTYFANFDGKVFT